MNSSASQDVIDPVVKSLLVNLPVPAAFALFTSGIARWWPLVTHSVGGVDAISCHIEGWVGGRIYEVMKDSLELTWGTLLTWEPPHRLEFTFHPGRAPETAQTVEVLFQPEGSDTRLTLTHRGWESLAGDAFTRRSGYETGWDIVLAQYTQTAISAGS